MRENITSQSVLFEGGFVRPVLAAFDQPASSSDGGALLLKLAGDRLGLAAVVAGALPDEREAGKVKHSLLSVVQQRVFGIGNGYEDANDAARLRDDPTPSCSWGAVLVLVVSWRRSRRSRAWRTLSIFSR